MESDHDTNKERWMEEIDEYGNIIYRNKNNPNQVAYLEPHDKLREYFQRYGKEEKDWLR